MSIVLLLPSEWPKKFCSVLQSNFISSPEKKKKTSTSNYPTIAIVFKLILSFLAQQNVITHTNIDFLFTFHPSSHSLNIMYIYSICVCVCVMLWTWMLHCISDTIEFRIFIKLFLIKKHLNTKWKRVQFLSNSFVYVFGTEIFISIFSRLENIALNR